MPWLFEVKFKWLGLTLLKNIKKYYKIACNVLLKEKRDIMELNVAVMSGDGIGPEIVGEARKVLEKIGQK